MQDIAGLRTTWYRDIVLSRNARSPSANEGWMMKSGEERRLDSEGLVDHGTKQRDVEFSLESNCWLLLSTTFWTWRSILRKWRHVTARIRDDFVLCLDCGEHGRYGACVCRTSRGRARGNCAMIFRYGEPRGTFGVACSKMDLFLPLSYSSLYC